MLRVLLYPQEQRAFIPISARQMEMAEGGLFPEEKACFADGERQLAERGPMGQPPCALRHAYDSGTNRPR